MNNETAQLLQQIAAKLGTTSAYLWSVLLKQARIQCILDGVYLILIFALVTVVYKLHQHLDKQEVYDDSRGYAVLMVAVGALCLFLIIVAGSLIGEIVNAYLNPEYWALHEILSGLKS